MLRLSIAPSRRLLSYSARPQTTSQWLSKAGASGSLASQRFYADSKLPANAPASVSSLKATKPPDGAADAKLDVSKPEASEPTTAAKVESASSSSSSSPPPPPPPPTPQVKTRKRGRFRRYLVYLVLTTGVAYAGGVFLALKSDNFHDFFTEYIPYGEESVLYFEERDFYRRFPNALRHRPSSGPRSQDQKITIPSKSGLTWKIAGEEEEAGSDLSQKGRHMSAVEESPENGGKKPAQSAAAEPKEPAAVKKTKNEAEAPTEPTGEAAAPNEVVKEEIKEEPRKPAVSAMPTIELVQVKEGDEPVVQEVVKAFNDIIAAISADENSGRFFAPISKTKEDLIRIAERISALKTEAQSAADEKIKAIHATFDESARELIRRFEETRAQDAAQFREEYEAERERLAQAYQDKIKTELQRAQEIAEQRLKNELVEQAIELNRKFLHDVRELVEREREGRLSKLDELSANVGELDKLTSGWREVIDSNLQTQQLQVAVDAVRSALERSDAPRPFIRELVAVKELASDDPVVEAAIASINPAAYQRGIPPTAQIIDRFRRVAGEVRKASLLPENAGIASHAASFILSKVMFKRDGLADGDDVESILLRTENLLEEGNLDAAAREMNALHGWAKILSKDWLSDVRRVLEVKQALEVIETEARLQCLRVE